MRRVVTSALRGQPGLDGAAVWAAALWREPVFERRIAAVELLQQAVRRLAAADLVAVEELIRDAGTWALVDGLAGNVAGVSRSAIPPRPGRSSTDGRATRTSGCAALRCSRRCLESGLASPIWRGSPGTRGR